MKINLIVWRDSEGGGSRIWTDSDEVKEWAKEPPEICRTVGFLVDETDEAVTLTFSEHGGEYGAHLKIPKECIVSRSELHVIEVDAKIS